MGIPFRPKNNPGHEALSALKDGPVSADGMHSDLIRVKSLMLGGAESFTSWRGEQLHQYALRFWKRGELQWADKLFRWSISVLGDSQLGLARVKRDYGMMLCLTGRQGHGVTLIEEALAHHERDLSNAKHRHELALTETYLNRANILYATDSSKDLRNLVEFARTMASRGYDDRDQLVIAEFLLQRKIKPRLRSAMLVRQAEINSRHGRPMTAMIAVSKLTARTAVGITARVIGRRAH